METKVITSAQFSISWRDLLRSAIFAAVTSGLTLVQQSLDAGNFTFDWRVIGSAALAAFIGKLLINFMQSDRVVTVTGAETNLKDTVKQIKKVV